MGAVCGISVLTPNTGGYGLDGADASSEDAFRQALLRQQGDAEADASGAEKRDTAQCTADYANAAASAAVTAETLKRPGDCTYRKHDELQAEVNRACKGQVARCEDTDSVQTINEKIDMHAACMSARQRINATC